MFFNMKHTWNITLILLGIFFLAQVMGLLVVDKYLDHQKTIIEGKPVFQKLPYNLERPQIEENTSYIYLIVAIIIGTLLFMLLIR